jgi:hypothetical protein
LTPRAAWYSVLGNSGSEQHSFYVQSASSRYGQTCLHPGKNHIVTRRSGASAVSKWCINIPRTKSGFQFYNIQTLTLINKLHGTPCCVNNSKLPSWLRNFLLLWNPKVHRHVHQSQPLHPTLNQFHTVHPSTSHYSTIRFSVILQHTPAPLCKIVFLLRISNNNVALRATCPNPCYCI